MIKLELGKQIVMYENSSIKQLDIKGQDAKDFVCYMRCSIQDIC